MWQILLLIVKILGMLLLSLLALCLLLLSLVLFVPIRYSGKGSSFQQLQGKITVSWLLHLVHVSVSIRREQVIWILRVCGIPIKSNRGKAHKEGDKESNKSKKHSKEKRPKGTILLDGEDEISTEEALPLKEADGLQNVETHTLDKDLISSDQEPISLDKESIILKSPEQEEENPFTRENKEASDEKKARSVLEKIQNWFRQVAGKVKGFWEKLWRFKENLSSFIEWWRQEATQLAFTHCKEELWRFLKHIIPRSYNVDLRFGTGDPASTGQILGVLGILYPVTKGRLQVTPEFQEKVLQGVFVCKGRIHVFKLLAIAWRVYRDKNVREAYNTWKEKKAA